MPRKISTTTKKDREIRNVDVYMNYILVAFQFLMNFRCFGVYQYLYFLHHLIL